MASSMSASTSVKHSFPRQIEGFKSPKSDINALILDYLTVAGYPNAAAKFSKEANLQPQQDLSSIRARQQIQNAIHKGDIQGAIEALNEFDPEILDNDSPLHFALLRLQLVELIRTCTSTPGGDITPALEFATAQLGPRAPTNMQFLEDLEKTMALLVFPHDNLEPQLAALLRPSLRWEVADKVNKAILHRQEQRRNAAIRHLVQMRLWSEDGSRRDAKKNLPTGIEIGLDDEYASQDGTHENGHEPMITN